MKFSILAAALMALAPAAAALDDGAVWIDGVYHVRAGSLDLAQPQQRAQFLARVERAAARVCFEEATRVGRARCAEEAVARAMDEAAPAARTALERAIQDRALAADAGSAILAAD